MKRKVLYTSLPDHPTSINTMIKIFALAIVVSIPLACFIVAYATK